MLFSVTGVGPSSAMRGHVLVHWSLKRLCIIIIHDTCESEFGSDKGFLKQDSCKKLIYVLNRRR